MKRWIFGVLALGLISDAVICQGQEDRYFRISGPVPATITTFSTDGFVTWTNEATNTTFVVQTALSLSGSGNWIDYIQFPATNSITSCRLLDFNPPAGMTLIPSGQFQMGDAFVEGGYPVTNDIPVHTVYVSAVYMDKCEVSLALWNDVFVWATNNGYSFSNSGTGKAPDHPVVLVDWYDCVKWCNARSEKEGRTPAYYTDSSRTSVYRAGQSDVQADSVNWSAGYRLPTEAEWEKAARGGVSGRRFSWGINDTIDQSVANYYSSTVYAYDAGPVPGYHPSYHVGADPFTSPAGSFAPNGYGLYDMIGNVSEWCWDKYSATWYSDQNASQSDTSGPMGSLGDDLPRIFRGGSYGNDAFNSRVAFRKGSFRPSTAISRGFRTVLPAQR